MAAVEVARLRIRRAEAALAKAEGPVFGKTSPLESSPLAAIPLGIGVEENPFILPPSSLPSSPLLSPSPHKKGGGTFFPTHRAVRNDYICRAEDVLEHDSPRKAWSSQESSVMSPMPLQLPSRGPADHFVGSFVGDPIDLESRQAYVDHSDVPSRSAQGWSRSLLTREAALLRLLQSSLAQRDELRAMANAHRREGNEYDALKAEVVSLRVQLKESTERSTAAEAELTKVQRQHENNSVLEKDVAELKSLLETETRQRIAAEVALAEQKAELQQFGGAAESIVAWEQRTFVPNALQTRIRTHVALNL